MRGQISTSTVDGFDAVVMENERIRVTVLPALGGRIWECVDLRQGTQWIWHRDDVPLAEHDANVEYDAVWAGGWEELFPNDAATSFEGRELPDHGEWWNRRWSVESVSDAPVPTLRLACSMRVVRARCTKEIRLPAGQAAVEVSYRIESEEETPVHFLFKQHLPIQVTPSCRIVAPGGMVTAVDPTFSGLMPDADPRPWPVATDGVNLDVVRPRESRTQEFVYIRDLPESWCAIEDPARRSALRMEWDARQLPFLWLFITYGGWRDAYTVVLEPCSNLPKELHEAVRLCQSAVLRAGEVFETRVTVTLAPI